MLESFVDLITKLDDVRYDFIEAIKITVRKRWRVERVNAI